MRTKFEFQHNICLNFVRGLFFGLGGILHKFMYVNRVHKQPLFLCRTQGACLLFGRSESSSFVRLPLSPLSTPRSIGRCPSKKLIN